MNRETLTHLSFFFHLCHHLPLTLGITLTLDIDIGLHLYFEYHS